MTDALTSRTPDTSVWSDAEDVVREIAAQRMHWAEDADLMQRTIELVERQRLLIDTLNTEIQACIPVLQAHLDHLRNKEASR